MVKMEKVDVTHSYSCKNQTWRTEARDAACPPEHLQSKPMLLWMDPPFGTGKTQVNNNNSYYDVADIGYVSDAILAWLPKMDDNGTVCVCMDYRGIYDVVATIKQAGWVHRGDIVWTFGLGRQKASWWGNRHNVIATFTKTADSGIFNYEAVPTTARLSPKGKYQDDKKVGSVWYYTMSNSDKERVKYPNQKPLDIVAPFISVHTQEGDLVVDPFMGSGTTGAAAVNLGRRFWGGDTNINAVEIATKRIIDLNLPSLD